MGQEILKQTILLEDGRKADKIVREESSPSGESKVITELYTEPQIEKRLTKRVVEYKKPVVVQRELETVDEVTGEVVDRKIESIEPTVKMELREHISTQNTVQALSTDGDNCNCYVTQEDMRETFKEGLLAVVKAMREAKEEVEPAEQATHVSMMQAVVGEKLVQKAQSAEWVSYALYGGLATGLAAFIYFAFFYVA